MHYWVRRMRLAEFFSAWKSVNQSSAESIPEELELSGKLSNRNQVRRLRLQQTMQISDDEIMPPFGAGRMCAPNP